MRLGLACLAISATIISAVWAWLGNPVPMPPSPLAAGEKVYCLSYSPFRGSQTPLNPGALIPPEQIDDDLARLAKITDCVRTYSVEFGQDKIAEIAARYGLKVMQGIWLSSKTEKNQEQIAAAVALANRYPDTIRSIVVGNEVLLRGEMSGPDLANAIRTVKSQVKVPVTYADVWEFWLRHRDVAAVADFITIHILPYWEDFPIPGRNSAAHVDAIYRQMAQAFAGKEVIIGEVGWPSAGRMREGALPSPSEQARVVHDVLALAKRDNIRVNVIEAFDEPWKRALEGTVGGHWGLLDDGTRSLKFEWGKAVSNHPYWVAQAAGGVLFAVLVFGAAFFARRDDATPAVVWLAVSANAIVGGILIGWTIAAMPVESLGIGGWLRSLALAATALAAPPVLSAAMMRGTPLPPLSRLLGPAAGRVRDPLSLVIGSIMIAMLLLTILIALGLVFDPRYRDFPFAALTTAVVPFLLHSLLMARPRGGYGTAELTGAALLALSVPYIAFNEGLANWQSLWVCAALAMFAVSLVRVRDAQS